jgi:DNA-binding transcriptional MerR regulator
LPNADVRLKKHYSSREVAAMTGLTARQLQWWDARRVLAPAIPAHRTPAGGFTERRYSPIELIELAALADLRRHGFSVQNIRDILETLRRQFGVRLFDAISGAGKVTLLTDGHEIYARDDKGTLFNVLRAPGQPLLVVGAEGTLRELSARMRGRRRKSRTKA